jgi:hypothetical protein
MLLLTRERVSLADVAEDVVNTVDVVVDDGDVLTVLVHSVCIIIG